MNQPYNWTKWDGSHLDFDSDFNVPSGYKQDTISLSYNLDSLRAVNASFTTVSLKAFGGLQSSYHHESNLSIAPFAFSWSETPVPPSLEYTICTHEGDAFEFKSIDWFLAGATKNGKSIVSNCLDVNEAIDRMVRAIDLHGINEAVNNLSKVSGIEINSYPYFKKQRALKTYLETKRLQLGKSYYFHTMRFGGKNLFAQSGSQTPINFINSAITTIPNPIKMV